MPLRHVPLRRQLVTVIMVTSGAVLVLAVLSSLAFDYAFARRDLVMDLMGQAEIAADSSTAALAFGDPEAARETLAAFAGRPELERACVYDRQGHPFASYV